jgi:hypothetical protein
MKIKIDQYFNKIESIAGGGAKFFTIQNDPEIVIASYKDIPEPGCLTAFSFGLSSAEHKEWKNSRPELIISVNSDDVSWVLAMGEIIKNGREKSLFLLGDIIRFGVPISSESEISAFFIFSCNILDDDDININVDGWKINISQLYPIFTSEIDVIKKIGCENFFTRSEIDFFDVKRKPFVFM